MPFCWFCHKAAHIYLALLFVWQGEQTRKELDALKDMVMKMPTYSAMFEELPTTVAKANALRGEEEHELQVKSMSLWRHGDIMLVSFHSY